MFYWNLFFYEKKCRQLNGQGPSFNPCFIGTYSFTLEYILVKVRYQRRFNPCFIGTYSFTYMEMGIIKVDILVLILVLLELILLQITLILAYHLKLRFNPCFIGTYSFTMKSLLAMLVEYRCFNPCFIGTYSFTKWTKRYERGVWYVLILVLLELILLLTSFGVVQLQGLKF